MSEQRDAGGAPVWTLGWRLKRALAEGGVGAAEMAEHLGYSKAQVSRYLNDHGEPPRRNIIRLWAMRCGVPYGWLLTGDATSSGPDGPGAPAVYPPWDSNPEPAGSVHALHRRRAELPETLAA